MPILKLSLLLFLTACGVASASDMFRDVSFESAQSTARSEKKVVMIDFFTTWCVPCKKLDMTTWKDAGVIEWVSKNCIALRLDAEKESELARRYNIGAYPTILMLSADGKEIDRIVGYKDAATFLSDAADALQGKDGVARAKEKLQGHEKDPMARQDYGRALAQAGKNDEALREFLWCFDHGVDDPSSGYSGVRASFLLGDIKRLGAVYPAALEALVKRRDAAEAKLDKNSDDYESASDMIAIDRELGTLKRSLAVYDRIEKAGPIPWHFRLAANSELFPLLVADRRYQPALDLLDDPKGYVHEEVHRHDELPGMQDPAMKEAMAQAAAFLKVQTVSTCAAVHEALLGVGKTEEAEMVASELIQFAPTGGTYSTLVKSATRAGQNDVARILGERGLTLVPESERAVVRSALDGVPKAK